MAYEKLVKELLENIGGQENVKVLHIALQDCV